MLRGQAWQGFTGRASMALPGAAPAARTGVGARDGEPTVFSREEQTEAQRQWKRDQVGNTSAKEETGPAAIVDLAVDKFGTQVLPMTLFLLYKRWRKHTSAAEGFQEAVRATLQRERDRAALVVDRRRVGNHAWAWPGGFVDWMTRHAPPGEVRFCKRGRCAGG